MNARWYNPDLGRFISEDPAGQGMNWYAYCNNSPLTNIDPSGRDWGVSGVQLGWGSLLLRQRSYLCLVRRFLRQLSATFAVLFLLGIGLLTGFWNDNGREKLLRREVEDESIRRSMRR